MSQFEAFILLIEREIQRDPSFLDRCRFDEKAQDRLLNLFGGSQSLKQWLGSFAGAILRWGGSRAVFDLEGDSLDLVLDALLKTSDVPAISDSRHLLRLLRYHIKNSALDLIRHYGRQVETMPWEELEDHLEHPSFTLSLSGSNQFVYPIVRCILRELEAYLTGVSREMYRAIAAFCADDPTATHELSTDTLSDLAIEMLGVTLLSEKPTRENNRDLAAYLCDRLQISDNVRKDRWTRLRNACGKFIQEFGVAVRFKCAEERWG